MINLWNEWDRIYNIVLEKNFHSKTSVNFRGHLT